MGYITTTIIHIKNIYIYTYEKNHTTFQIIKNNQLICKDQE